MSIPLEHSPFLAGVAILAIALMALVTGKTIVALPAFNALVEAEALWAEMMGGRHRGLISSAWRALKGRRWDMTAPPPPPELVQVTKDSILQRFIMVFLGGAG